MIAKAVVHVHSGWSYDGKWDLTELARFFGRLGYHIVLTTEHDLTFDHRRWEAYKTACRVASTNRLLVVPGIEYSDTDNDVHVMVWGVEKFFGNNQPTTKTLKEVKRKSGFCVLSHPSRRKAWQKVDEESMALIDGIELWNRKFDGVMPSREATALLKSHRKAMPFVGMDFHRANQFFPLAMMIQVDGALSEKNVVSALKDGHCQPQVMGIPALRFTNGLLSFGAATCEQLRRLLVKFGKTPLLEIAKKCRLSKIIK